MSRQYCLYCSISQKSTDLERNATTNQKDYEKKRVAIWVCRHYHSINFIPNVLLPRNDVFGSLQNYLHSHRGTADAGMVEDGMSASLGWIIPIIAFGG